MYGCSCEQVEFDQRPVNSFQSGTIFYKMFFFFVSISRYSHVLNVSLSTSGVFEVLESAG